MYCINCGAKLLDDSVFCTECGTRVKREEKIATIEVVPAEKIEKPIEVQVEEPAEVVTDNGAKKSAALAVDDAVTPIAEETISELEEQLEKENEVAPDASEENASVVQEEQPEAVYGKNEKGKHFSIKKPVISKVNMPKVPKKKWLLIAGIAMAVLMVAVIIMAFTMNAGTSNIDTKTHFALSARLTDDGTAYIPLPDGKCVVINEEVQTATITADRTRIVVLLKDGSVYVTDTNLTEKNAVAENGVSISSVRNDGFLYEDEDEMVYRVLFADYSSVCLGEDVAAIAAENNISVLFATDEGGIYTMAYNSQEKNKIGTYEDSVDLEAISDDGQISVWVTEEYDVQTIVLNEGEDRVTLGEVSAKSNYTYVTFTDDQKMLTVLNTNSDCMWMKRVNEEPIKVRLGATLESTFPYSAGGYITNQNADELTALYVSTEGDSGANVYHISMDGERERVISKIRDFQIANGNVIYLSVDNTLYCAKLDGTVLTDEEKIASDVDVFKLSNNGMYVYYMKDCSEKTSSGALYCYKIGTEEPVRVDSEAGCYVLTYIDEILLYMDISIDGKTVYYFTDIEEIEDTYIDQGTLMMWTYGDEDSVRIASEATCYSVTSTLECDEINPKSFTFLKYSSLGSDEKLYLNWMYFNGEEATRIATDVLYK